MICRDGAADRTVGVPDGFDYELHNRKDIEKLLGDKAWAISFKDSACRCFGYMVSPHPYSNTSTGAPVNWASTAVMSTCKPSFMSTARHHDSFITSYDLQVAKGYKYIYTIDDDCFVAKNPTGEDINALEQHIRNLLTPSTPFFFNTLYDPYAPGSDFVRGYPFSMREGVPTAVSHGASQRIPALCHGMLA